MFHLALIVVPWINWIVAGASGIALIGIVIMMGQGVLGAPQPWIFFAGIVLILLGISSMLCLGHMESLSVPASYLQQQSSVVRAALQANLVKTHEPLTIQRMVSIETQLPIVHAQLDAIKPD